MNQEISSMEKGNVENAKICCGTIKNLLLKQSILIRIADKEENG